ncbi:RAD55 family ATPase [Melioribacteraceae bacterium 4301-Me]|uniref:RAD55 family ATPase n=1 Tax=Pyranulibacter aquaticus TaxID=3163344 RepID=UPI003599D117
MTNNNVYNTNRYLMSAAVRLISSGFSLIDHNWGGVYKGGSYFVVGPRKSGRTLLGLQFAIEAAKSSEVCVYFTLMRPKDLMIQAASLNFDIQSYMNQNLIIVVRVAPPKDIYEMYNPDDYLVEYLNDIATVVNQYGPSRIIFDELTPFVGFRNLEILREAFLNTLEVIEERDITSLFIIGEPATQKAHSIVSILTQHVTGVIQLKKLVQPDKYQTGTATIIPNVGHTQGQFTSSYRIEPYKGVTVDFTPDFEYTTEPSLTLERKQKTATQSGPQTEPYEPYAFSNIYNYNDFLLLLNNQIALYKSTGQAFNLVSFKLDPAAQVKGLLSINQLQNAIKKSTSKKDKICVLDNKVIVLLVRGTLKNAVDLMSNIQNYLPSKDPSYINTVFEYITIFNLQVDDRVENAEAMMQTILAAENSAEQTYQPLNRFIG